MFEDQNVKDDSFDEQWAVQENLIASNSVMRLKIEADK